MPVLRIKKSFDDFWAFHTAISNKFKNIRFVDFPKSSTFKSSKPSERIEIFQKLFDQILHSASQYDTLRTKMLSMLYKFVVADSKLETKIIKGDSIAP